MQVKLFSFLDAHRQQRNNLNTKKLSNHELACKWNRAFHKSHFQNYTKNAPEIGSKLLQNGAEKGPDEPQALQKVVARAHRQLTQAKGTYKDDSSTPKKR